MPLSVYGAFSCAVPLPHRHLSGYPGSDREPARERSGWSRGASASGCSPDDGQRGVSTGQIDIFAAVGSLVPYQVKLTVPVTNGQMVFSWVAVAGKGNPVGSAIDLGAALPAVIPPAGCFRSSLWPTGGDG